MWLGYLAECPDYKTQERTLGELRENLREIYRVLTGDQAPPVKRTADLHVA